MKSKSAQFLVITIIAGVVLAMISWRCYEWYLQREKQNDIDRVADIIAAGHENAISIDRETLIFEYDPFQTIGKAIRRAAAKGEFDLSNLEKLDFSLPGTKHFGDNKNLEIFNPEGPFKISIGQGKPVFQEGLSGNPYNLQYVLFRHIDSKNNTVDWLFGVIDNVSEKVCERVSEKVKTLYPMQFHELSDGAIVDDIGIHHLGPQFCVINDSGNRKYLFNLIALRRKDMGDQTWR